MSNQKFPIKLLAIKTYSAVSCLHNKQLTCLYTYKLVCYDFFIDEEAASILKDSNKSDTTSCKKPQKHQTGA